MDWILCVIYYPIRENTSTVLEKRKNDWRIDMELTINNLSKEYGRKKAVNHFSAKLTMCLWSTRGKWCGQDNFDANDLRCPN